MIKQDITASNAPPPQNDYSFNNPMFEDDLEYSPIVPPTSCILPPSSGYTPSFQTPPVHHQPVINQSPSPVPLIASNTKTSGHPPLPSLEIKKTSLHFVEDVLSIHRKLLCESKIGTLAVKLARKAFLELM